MALSVLAAAAAVPASAAPLAAERWNKRIVLVFAAEESAARGQADALLADRDALAERDMLIVTVSGERVSLPFGGMGETPAAAALRNAYGVSADAPFTVILVGKDGGEKLRRTAPVPAAAILDLIDSMPMRRSEARR
jgi:hypothetical protein